MVQNFTLIKKLGKLQEIDAQALSNILQVILGGNQ